jgi:hypothetical protein
VAGRSNWDFARERPQTFEETLKLETTPVRAIESSLIPNVAVFWK